MAKTGNVPPRQEAPTYQRQSSIQPVADTAHLNYKGAMAHHTAVTDGLVAIGQQIAQNFSIDQAMKEGIKAGKTPGRNLFPSVNATTEAFNKAYLSEEYNQLSSTGDKFLNKAYIEYSQNPTGESLLKFEENSAEALSNIVNMSSEKNKSPLKRSLEGSYDSKFYQLSNAVASANRKQMIQMVGQNYDESLSAVEDLYANGMEVDGDNKYLGTLEYLKSQREANLISEAEYRAYSKSFQLKASVAKEQAIAQNHFQNGEGAEYLSEVAKRPNTVENQLVKQAVSKQFSQYNSMIGTQSHIAKSQGIQAATEGTLTSPQAIELRQQMTESDSIEFDAQLSKLSRQKAVITQGIDYVSANKDNASKLSLAPSGAVDAWFDNQIQDYMKLNDGDVPSLREQVSMAANIRTSVPKLNKQIESAILKGNVQQSMDAMIVYNDPTLSKALDDVGKEAEAKALKYFDYLQAGNTSDEAWAKLNYEAQNKKPGEKERIEEDWKDLTSNKGERDLSDSSKRLSQVAKALNYPKEDIPAGLDVVWQKEMKKNYTYSGDWDRAAAMTKKTFDRTYGYSHANGRKELMYMPPEKFIPNYPLGSNYVQQQVSQGFEQIASQYKKLYDENKEQDFYYEADKSVSIIRPKESGGDEFYSPQKPGEEDYAIKENPYEKGEIKAKKIYRDGSVKKGTIVIQADNRTLLPENGMVPNYYVGFEYESADVVDALRDPSNQMNPVRYQPDFAPIEKQIYEDRKKLKIDALNFTIEQENEYLRQQGLSLYERWAETMDDNPYGY